MASSIPSPLIATSPRVESAVRNLIAAVHNDELEVVRATLKRSPKLAHTEGDLGWTPMEVAVREGTLNTFKVFLELVKNLNRKDELGRTLAHFCAESDNHLGNLVLLSNKCADLTIVSKERLDPMKTALNSGASGIAGFLLVKGVAIDLPWARAAQLPEVSAALVASYEARAQARAVIDEISVLDLKAVL